MVRKENILEAMEERCKSQGHDWTGAATASVPVIIYEICKWCGTSRRL